MEGVIRFRRKAKLNPRYIKPFEILHIVGKVSYELALSPYSAVVHLFFHDSILWSYILDELDVLHSYLIWLDGRLTFMEEALLILAREIR